MNADKELDIVMEWVTERLSSKSEIPRLDDVIRYTYNTLGFKHLKPNQIARRLRLHPAYLMSSSQTRGRQRSRRYRPIVTNTLGMLHGDIGYFSIKRDGNISLNPIVRQMPTDHRTNIYSKCHYKL